MITRHNPRSERLLTTTRYERRGEGGAGEGVSRCLFQRVIVWYFRLHDYLSSRMKTHGLRILPAQRIRGWKTGSQIYPLPAYEPHAVGNAFAPLHANPNGARSSSTPGCRWPGSTSSVLQQPFLRRQDRAYWALMTGGGFHLPVSASDFGA
jgi:hypothetical protein